MKQTLTHQARRAGLALAAALAFVALEIGTAQAQTFTSANLSLNSFGFLDCSFKETGLEAGASVDYTCGATTIGWVTQCFFKNKPVSNSPITLYVAHDQTTDRTLVASRQGTIMSGILTAYPTVEEEPAAEPCANIIVGRNGHGEAEVVETITAIRWCNNSLVDTTNEIVGAEVSELFEQFERSATASVPSCGDLAGMSTNLPNGTPL